MKAGELISVIVPVYNVEKYLEECIESIQRQTYKNIEIIVVDDGSKDSSGVICDELAKSDERITVYHKINGGLSSARNYGLKHVNGEYVTFIDSDDYIKEDFIEDLYTTIVEDGSDIVVTGHEKCDESGNIIESCYDSKKVISKKEFWAKFIFGEEAIYGAIESCMKLYSSKIFSELHFPEGWLNEDEAVIYDVISRCDKISISDNNGYYYRIRSGSIMNVDYSLDRFKTIKFQITRSEAFFLEGEQRFAECTLMTAINMYNSGRMLLPDSKECATEINKMKNELNRISAKLRRKTKDIKFIIRTVTFLVSPDIFVKVFS